MKRTVVTEKETQLDTVVGSQACFLFRDSGPSGPLAEHTHTQARAREKFFRERCERRVTERDGFHIIVRRRVWGGKRGERSRPPFCASRSWSQRARATGKQLSTEFRAPRADRNRALRRRYPLYFAVPARRVSLSLVALVDKGGSSSLSLLFLSLVERERLPIAFSLSLVERERERRRRRTRSAKRKRKPKGGRAKDERLLVR